MNIGWATFALAEQTPVHIADAGAARSGPSVNTYEEGLRQTIAVMVNAASFRVFQGEQRRNCDDGTSQKPSEMGGLSLRTPAA